MNITQLTVYPVKSLKGIDLQQSELYTHGLAWDRRWMLVDAQQRFVTQRQLPALATIGVALDERSLVLSHPSMAPIAISLDEPQGNLRHVTVWNDHCKAHQEGEEVSRWLEAALGDAARGLSLVRFASDFPRPVEADFLAGDSADTFFSDGYPFLVTTTGSLDALNQALVAAGQSPIPMNRFRPNIVVEGATAWAEDRWAGLRVPTGGIELTLRKPCQRCKITTVDQQTGAVPAQGEPLKTLLSLNTQPHLKGAFFGQNATLTKGQGATIRVGDAVEALPREV